MTERILCAAIYVDTGKKEGNCCYGYPETGLVFCGLRHNDCFTLLHAWEDKLTKAERDAVVAIEQYALRGKNQGFLTSKGRFVNRREAYLIALHAGQCRPSEDGEHAYLTSEDIY